MKIDKKDALKNLWKAYEDLMKSLKSLSDNPVVGNIMDTMWITLDSYQKDIRNLLKFDTEFGKWYKWTTYREEESLIFKTLNLETYNSGLGIKIQVLVSSKTQHNYEKVEEIMVVPLDIFKNKEKIKEIDFNPQELPLYINYEFKSPLFDSIIKESEISTS